MLITLIALAAVLLSNAVQALIAVAGSYDASEVSPSLRPEDPTTLTLALIGGGTVAVYLTVRRQARKPLALEMAGTDSSIRQQLADVAADDGSGIPDVQPSRGAA